MPTDSFGDNDAMRVLTNGVYVTIFQGLADLPNCDVMEKWEADARVRELLEANVSLSAFVQLLISRPLLLALCRLQDEELCGGDSVYSDSVSDKTRFAALEWYFENVFGNSADIVAGTAILCPPSGMSENDLKAAFLDPLVVNFLRWGQWTRRHDETAANAESYVRQLSEAHQLACGIVTVKFAVAVQPPRNKLGDIAAGSHRPKSE